MKTKKQKKVSIIMGSQSDYKTMKYCGKILKILKINYESKIISAHRTPKRMYDFATSAEKKGFAVIIAGAGMAAHLPGMVASLSSLPTIAVPCESKKLKGLDSLLSCHMPNGIPLAVMPINGAMNAGLYAASIIATFDQKVKTALDRWKLKQTKSVNKKPK